MPQLENWHDIKSGLKESDWKELTTFSAKVWIDIANEWLLIRTPDLMDLHSEELKEFNQYSIQKNEELEYQRYLILKAKFEK